MLCLTCVLADVQAVKDTTPKRPVLDGRPSPHMPSFMREYYQRCGWLPIPSTDSSSQTVYNPPTQPYEAHDTYAYQGYANGYGHDASYPQQSSYDNNTYGYQYQSQMYTAPRLLVPGYDFPYPQPQAAHLPPPVPPAPGFNPSHPTFPGLVFPIYPPAPPPGWQSRASPAPGHIVPQHHHQYNGYESQVPYGYSCHTSYDYGDSAAQDFGFPIVSSSQAEYEPPAQVEQVAQPAEPAQAEHEPAQAHQDDMAFYEPGPNVYAEV